MWVEVSCAPLCSAVLCEDPSTALNTLGAECCVSCPLPSVSSSQSWDMVGEECEMAEPLSPWEKLLAKK